MPRTGQEGGTFPGRPAGVVEARFAGSGPDIQPSRVPLIQGPNGAGMPYWVDGEDPFATRDPHPLPVPGGGVKQRHLLENGERGQTFYVQVLYLGEVPHPAIGREKREPWRPKAPAARQNYYQRLVRGAAGVGVFVKDHSVETLLVGMGSAALACAVGGNVAEQESTSPPAATDNDSASATEGEPHRITEEVPPTEAPHLTLTPREQEMLQYYGIETNGAVSRSQLSEQAQAAYNALTILLGYDSEWQIDRDTPFLNPDGTLNADEEALSGRGFVHPGRLIALRGESSGEYAFLVDGEEGLEIQGETLPRGTLFTYVGSPELDLVNPADPTEFSRARQLINTATTNGNIGEIRLTYPDGGASTAWAWFTEEAVEGTEEGVRRRLEAYVDPITGDRHTCAWDASHTEPYPEADIDSCPFYYENGDFQTVHYQGKTLPPRNGMIYGLDTAGNVFLGNPGQDGDFVPAVEIVANGDAYEIASTPTPASTSTPVSTSTPEATSTFTPEPSPTPAPVDISPVYTDTISTGYNGATLTTSIITNEGLAFLNDEGEISGSVIDVSDTWVNSEGDPADVAVTKYALWNIFEAALNTNANVQQILANAEGDKDAAFEVYTTRLGEAQRGERDWSEVAPTIGANDTKTPGFSRSELRVEFRPRRINVVYVNRVSDVENMAFVNEDYAEALNMAAGVNVREVLGGTEQPYVEEVTIYVTLFDTIISRRSDTSAGNSLGFAFIKIVDSGRNRGSPKSHWVVNDNSNRPGNCGNAAVAISPCVN